MSHCDISVQQCVRNVANHKKATMFWRQKCGEIFKNPHKNEKIHICHTFEKKVWRLKPLVYKESSRFPQIHTFEKLFGKKFLEKIF